MKHLLYILCLSTPLYAAQASSSPGENSSDMRNILEQKRHQLQMHLFFISKKRALALSKSEIARHKHLFNAVYWYKKHADDLSAAMHHATKQAAMFKRVINRSKKQSLPETMDEVIAWYANELAEQKNAITKTNEELSSIRTMINAFHEQYGCLSCMEFSAPLQVKELREEEKRKYATRDYLYDKIWQHRKQKDALKEEQAFLRGLHVPVMTK